ncbi:PREDICTED: zinc finger CCCH domain-containing protein 19 isoform X2 [Erythranthe guttata]|uniref:zinc finger CCCH domain-containing protein 19 isoform X2 n=1 Tax=Erythranthe guttata TaxID=4155 RepID=UPI00064DAC0E|nr:PREDICTED: zinc finger CCCH domain-containing protein 19 isoform X2 [Erythranthe guttata]|eukprot:XP_012837108.1 PREDICTED: zinc finger CCCH domain-containing protein 19 isoform X2 [Erythranthe guttata]
MEEEKLDFVGIESSEKCEAIPEFGESTLTVGGDRDPSPENKPDADEKGEGILVNHAEEQGSEFIAEGLTDMVEQSVVAEEGGCEITAAQIEELPIEMEAEEEAKIDEAEEEAEIDAEGVAAVTDTEPLFSETQVISGGYELGVDPELKMKDDEEFSPVVDTKIEMVVTDSESKMDYREDEMLADPQIGLEAEQEFTPAVDSIVEGVVTDVSDAHNLADPQIGSEAEQEFTPAVDPIVEGVVTDVSDAHNLADPQIVSEAEQEFTPAVDPIVEGVVTDASDAHNFSELQVDSNVDELHATVEGIEAEDYKSEGDMDEGENVKAVGGLDNESADSLIEANTETVVKDDEIKDDEVDEPKVDFVENDSEVGAAEKPADVEEEKVDFINEEMPITEVKRETEATTEINTFIGNTTEQEQVNESTGVKEFVSCDVSYDHAVDKEVAVEESLMSSNSELDESLTVAENEDTIVKEEPSSGDIKTETEALEELESTRKVVVEEEIQLEGHEVETEMESEVMADRIPDDEDGKMETEEQMGSEVMADQIPDDEDGKMETEEQMGSEVMADEIQDDDGKMETEETTSDVDETGQDIYDSPAALQDEEDDTMAAEEDDTMPAEEDAGAHDTEIETETDIAEAEKTSGGKRKRNKLSKSTPISKATPKASSRKTVGEDVCFICFDGGELVLCDRRGCPKAYHPSCVNRDEAFFKSKGRWNCGWHLCSICEKNARYMCYTCTFSLCKSCTKDAVILCIQGNKGFCETCMRTVMLIESNEQGDKDDQIDFDDKSSWEFLFKDYYTELKAKLSLSSDDIAQAKNPWKGADMSGPSKQESSEAQADGNDGGSGSEDSIEKLETVRPKRRKIRKQSKSRSKGEGSVSTSTAAGDKANNLSDNSEWASKELLEFVSHMKDGDTSILSQFDVQALLLEYIQRNKLRDPRKKSQIVCDGRLENLFGKSRVGHFEMLKLLESHFFVRDEHNDDLQGSVVDTENSLLDIDGSGEPLTKGVKDKKRKPRRKGDSRGPQSNLDDYAAIDMHNIGLIYLRRKLIEDLLEDDETFHDKAVGTFVRIRISGSTQKQDMYRLVQVVGTSKAPEPYKIGKKSTDTMVEILNLDKTEIISIDTISNQEFTEEECTRLRQSIKCRLLSPLTVGEILDKTTEIQTARVNDWLEAEVLRLSHLRDRASDLGRRKELRECVEKLQLLKTPEERRRRLEETPKIHSDPKMDPSYESEDNSENENNRREAFMRSRGSGFSRRGRGPISPGSEHSVKDSWSSPGNITNKNSELSRASPGNNFSVNASHISEIANENSWNLEREKEKQESNYSEKLNAPTYPESYGGVTSVISQASLSSAVLETAAVKINESEKMWHYKDPSGKVQGPFSMVQLRKWNNTGYFPTGLQIWRNTDNQDNSVLLADALAGKFPIPSATAGNIISQADKLAGHSGKTSGTFLNQDNQNSGPRSKTSAEKWAVNDMTNMPSPTPTQRGHLINGAVPSPIIGTHSSTPASVLSAIIETATFSPTPNSQLGGSSAVSRHSHSTTVTEQHEVPMQGSNHQPPQNMIMSQNLQTDTTTTQGWGQSGQVQAYNWGTPSNVQNPSGSFQNSGSTVGIQQDMWRPTQGSVPNMIPPTTPNASIGVRPENPNMGWGGTNTMQANPNMGWVNPAPVNANANWMPAMQVPVPQPGSYVAPPAGNAAAANIQGWGAPAQGWGAPPVQGGPVPGNGWAPPGGNVGPPPPPAVNQGWGGPQAGNQGSWGGEQMPSGGQFMGGQRGPWNRQSSFGGGGGGGGGSRSKRDTLCPFNLNGRCKKGSRCDYMHS